jgi:hypothetical protein
MPSCSLHVIVYLLTRHEFELVNAFIGLLHDSGLQIIVTVYQINTLVSSL